MPDRQPLDTDLLWVDLETTGLDLGADYLLEIGFIVTAADLTEVARASWVIPLSADSVAMFRGDSDPAMRDMHDANGLWGECVAAYPDRGLPSIASDIQDWVSKHAPTAPLAGSSVGQFDVPWLRFWFPGVLADRTYRVADISAVREFILRWSPASAALIEARAASRKLHRVIPDLEDSINLARVIRDVLELGPTVVVPRHTELVDCPTCPPDDDDLPGMWESADFIGGASDAGHGSPEQIAADTAEELASWRGLVELRLAHQRARLDRLTADLGVYSTQQLDLVAGLLSTDRAVAAHNARIDRLDGPRARRVDQLTAQLDDATRSRA